MSSLKDSIDIAPAEKKVLVGLLRHYLPNTEVWAYGSRFKWTSGPASDLDLVALASPEQKAAVSKLREALETSSLPFRVDLFIWDEVPETFRDPIREKHVVLQESEKKEKGQIRGTEERMNWVNSTVGEFCPFAYGKSLPEKNREEGSIPVYGSNGIVGFHNSAYIADSGVIVGRKGSVGFIHFSEQDFWPIDTTFFVDKGTESENRFCYYLLSTLGLQSMNFDAAVPGLNRDNAHALKIRIPDSEKSRKDLVEPLKIIDDKIVLNRKLNETLEEMARTFFQSWFVDFDPVKAKLSAIRHGRDPEKACMAAISGKLRIPTGKPKHDTLDDQLSTTEELDAAIAKLDTLSEAQRNKLAQTSTHFPASFQESERGLIPKGWEVDEIGKEVSVFGGATPSTKEKRFWNGENAWATPKDLSGLPSKVLISTERQITNEGVAKISSGQLPVGTVLMSSRAPVGYLALATIPISINQGFIAIVCDKKLPNTFILLWAESVMEDIKSNASGSTFAEISKKAFRPIQVIIPDRTILSLFDQTVSVIYQEITSNEHQSRTLAQLRDMLLPKLLSGELNVEPN